MALNPPIPPSVIAASEPPATQASIRPYLIYINASAIAIVEEAQAATGAKFGPLKPYFIEI